MKNPIIILFVVVLGATIAWFAALASGRTKATASGSDTSSSAIYVIISGAMAFLGETLLGKHVPVQHLRRKLRLLKQRVKQETQTVRHGQAGVIKWEGHGFAHDDLAAKFRSSHTIARDHAVGEEPPCSR
jgi:hypothetical protein